MSKPGATKGKQAEQMPLREIEALASESGLLSDADLHTARDLVKLTGLDHADVYAVLLHQFRCLSEGSLCQDAAPAALALDLSVWAGERSAEWAEAFSRRLASGDLSPLVGAPGEFKPLIHVAGPDGGRLYFEKLHFFEATLIQRLEALLSAPEEPMNATRLQEIMRDVLEVRPVIWRGRSLALNEEQRRAVLLGLMRIFSIVSGGPGTGKTSILLTLLRALVRQGVAPDRIALAAPTGRAAQRMVDAVDEQLNRIPNPNDADLSLRGIDPSTLHRLLGAGGASGGFRHHAANPLEKDVVIVDEVSMVDVALMAGLLEALSPGTRLVLIGDPEQLPPVEAGAVLADLIPALREPCYSAELAGQLQAVDKASSIRPSAQGKPLPRHADRIVVLRHSYRSAQGVQAFAEAVRNADASALDACAWHGVSELQRRIGTDGVSLLQSTTDSPDDMRGVLASWFECAWFNDAGGESEILAATAACEAVDFETMQSAESTALLTTVFEYAERSRVLCALREGSWGAAGANAVALRMHQRKTGREAREWRQPGVPVMIRRNASHMGLHNGDCGLFLKLSGETVAVFRRGDGFVHMLPDLLPAHEPAFAMTVHKAQGSEYDRVLIVLPPKADHRLLTREILYTGITRARSEAHLLAAPDTLRAAVARTQHRHSGLRPWWQSPSAS